MLRILINWPCFALCIPSKNNKKKLTAFWLSDGDVSQFCSPFSNQQSLLRIPGIFSPFFVVISGLHEGSFLKPSYLVVLLVLPVMLLVLSVMLLVLPVMLLSMTSFRS
jgi:hypothetical protein